ncbi:MAG: HEAT repeat domain-containing protein [Burkholderiales bacterium]|nr:HEAT repeat domain-containing protein [Burkholderiales bacterium]
MNLDEFSRALDKSANPPLLECLDLFRELCRELDVQALLADELGRWLTQPRRTPPIVSESTVRLRRFGPLVLDVTVLRATQVPQIINSHQDILQSFCGNCQYDLFEILTEDGQPIALKHSAYGSVNNGDLFSVDGSRQIFVAHASEPVRFLSLSEFESRGVRHKFNSISLKQVGTFAASPASTTIQLAARFLGYYGDDSCVSALRHLLNDSIGAIQWEAACALTRVSRDDGVAAMKRLTSSVDSEIARAASDAIDQLAA